MRTWVILSNYFVNGFLGPYFTIPFARKAIETFLKEDENIISMETIGDFCYQFTTKTGETFCAFLIFWRGGRII